MKSQIRDASYNFSNLSQNIMSTRIKMDPQTSEVSSCMACGRQTCSLQTPGKEQSPGSSALPRGLLARAGFWKLEKLFFEKSIDQNITECCVKRQNTRKSNLQTHVCQHPLPHQAMIVGQAGLPSASNINNLITYLEILY